MSKTSNVACVLAGLALAACSSGDPQLMNIGATVGSGPDEFAILPSEELEIPEDLTALPSPNPGGSNRADPDPEADAIAALGGNVNRATSGSQSLMSHVGRFGVEAGIRNTLAAEDLAFRSRNDGRVMERLFNVNVYYRAYSGVSLDQYTELERLRRLGVRTPAAPPEGGVE